jgi:N-acetylmuramoyl-L-alanine amidase
MVSSWPSLFGRQWSMALLCTLAFVALPGVPAAAATAKEMYEAALVREQSVRLALDANDAPDAILGDAREVVAAYREVVRLYPASGYSDNALWQAGRLSVDLFFQFGNDRDRALGIRLLRLLRSEYPSSSLLEEVSAQLARAEQTEPDTAQGPPLPSRQAVASDNRSKAPSPANVDPGPSEASRRQTPRRIATVKDIRRDLLVDVVRVTIELDTEVDFYDERILNPVRVFVDLPYTRLSSNLAERTLRFDGDTEIVRQIRIGRHPNDVTRVVLEADGVASYSVYPLYNPYRLVIDSFKTAPPASAKDARGFTAPPAVLPAVTEPAAPTLPVVSADLRPEIPPPSAVDRSVVPASLPPAPPPVPASPPPAAPTTPPAKNAGGGYSMARQLGLGVSRIVIDPGHGGQDPGAKGKSIDESELVLDIALRVEKLLEKMPGVEVILTRRTDEYVPLQERTAIANRVEADLFLSIHANASPNASASGIETYFLNFATNMSAASVAARENAASGQAMGALPDLLKQIALNNKLDESRDFATTVQAAMIERLRKSNKSVKDLGVKQAPFVVLIGAAMPSVLAEISFVTNAQEARLLRGSAYRQRIAEALVGAISKYQSSLKSVPRVAQQ